MPYKKTKDGRLVNEVTLGDGYPLSNDLQPLKVGGEASPIEMSTSLPDGSNNGKVKVTGDLEVTGGLNFKNDVEVDLSFDDLSLSGDLDVAGNATFDSTTLAIDATNNRVGIGRTDPQTDLEVKGSSGPEIAIVGDADNTGVLAFGDSDYYKAGRLEYNHSTNVFTMDVASNERLELGLNTLKVFAHTDVSSGHNYKIDDTTVLSNDTLGSGVVNSSLTSVGTISSGTWNGTAIASAYLDSDTAHLSGTQTFSGTKTFSEPVTIHTDSDAILNLKSSDDNSHYIQFLENDGTRRSWIGMDSDLDRLKINANENGANEVEINTTNLDINAAVQISGALTTDSTIDGRDVATDGSKLDGIASGADVSPSIHWTRSTGGYFTANNTSQYTQSWEGDETWGNTVSITTALGGAMSVNYSDVYGGIWIAPAASKITKSSIVVRAVSYADDITIKLWKINPADLRIYAINSVDITMPNTSSIVTSNTDLSSGNEIEENYVLLATMEKQATTGSSRIYFTWTISGTYD